MNFLFKPISNSRQIGKKRPYSDIKWIVIHYTGNYSKGADAMAHFRYLQSATRYGSAHYFVDDKEIIQTIGDSFVAWSVGDNQGYGRYLNDCTNSNSINIEMCVNADSNQDKVYKNTVELTKNLMAKFKVPASKVCRHYDVSRKDCPHNFRKNNWAKWWQFKKDIEKPIEWKIDLSKDSEFGEIASKEKEEKVMKKDYKNHWAEKEIDEVKEAGIMKGYEDGSFKPDEKITRAEVAVIISKLLKKN
ncbi:MAG: N-acetylmuramoyl-L-alanine amidase [Peptoniphilus sp.]|uniref:N-acetylmuramoyl-L-alanine amidase n=1 Tax=Peptoniphilus sp. TaxID=1971214 RepID=UPI0025CD1317|nr:N-acetylmuramoyl-L-alanine amidase [Peptoniphilus sp.]MCI5643690.1 N-acetylmuramoyl-L-alanine amidase [Peptoniphilus sp.]